MVGFQKMMMFLLKERKKTRNRWTFRAPSFWDSKKKTYGPYFSEAVFRGSHPTKQMRSGKAWEKHLYLHIQSHCTERDSHNMISKTNPILEAGKNICTIHVYVYINIYIIIRLYTIPLQLKMVRGYLSFRASFKPKQHSTRGHNIDIFFEASLFCISSSTVASWRYRCCTKNNIHFFIPETNTSNWIWDVGQNSQGPATNVCFLRQPKKNSIMWVPY